MNRLNIAAMVIHRLCCLLFMLAIPHRLCAIPKAIAQIIQLIEAEKKLKKANPLKKKEEEKKQEQEKGKEKEEEKKQEQEQEKGKEKEEAQEKEHEKVCLLIDEAIKDSKLAKHPATWYYRGVIYEKRLKDNITSQAASTLLNETLIAYEQVKKLTLPHTQFYSFALERIAALWSYYLERAIRCAKQEAFDQAIDHFSICRRILPQEPTSLFYTAIVYQSNDKPEEALNYYKAYLQAKGPQVAIFRAMAAIYYHQLKNFDQAIAVLADAFTKFPLDNELLEECCLLYKAANRLDDYKAALLEAVTAQPKEPAKWYRYAYLLEDQELIEEAAFYYQQILQDAPHQYAVLRQLGLLLYNEAIKAYAVVQKLDTQIEKAEQGAHMQKVVWIVARLDPPLSAPMFLVYDHPLVQSVGLAISDRVKAASIDHTTPLFLQVNGQIAAELLRNKRLRMIIKVKTHLKQSVGYLQAARRQDKQDKIVAQALYYTYYHLQKYRSAYRLLQTMHKQKDYLHAIDDPFYVAEHRDGL